MCEVKNILGMLLFETLHFQNIGSTDFLENLSFNISAIQEGYIYEIRSNKKPYLAQNKKSEYYLPILKNPMKILRP
jgi:hypothetical protein